MFYLTLFTFSFRFCIAQSTTRILNNLVTAIVSPTSFASHAYPKPNWNNNCFIWVAQVIQPDSSNERNTLYVCFGYLWLDIVVSLIQDLTHLVTYITDNGRPHS